MDLKIVVKELIDKGLSKDQIIESLKELGVADAEKIYAEATTAPQSRKAPPVKAPEPAPKAEKPPAGGGMGEVSLSEIEGKEGKSLFGGEGQKPPKQNAPKTPEELVQELTDKGEEKKRKAEEEGLAMPEVEEEAGAKPEDLVEDVGDGKAASKKQRQDEEDQPPRIIFPSIEEEPEESSGKGEEASLKFHEDVEKKLAEIEGKPAITVEEKLDETIALLKALRELNKQILDTDRKLLLRAK
ncbi:TPA: hypothetical protein HA244_03720 [Candidatus Micrarchaeota archaeon]|nr:hypothetical protein [Candidatus Micrarchaeota archaeon]